jgi:Flp pilus assembly protein TadD
MRNVYEHRVEAAATGTRARAEVLVSCRAVLVVVAVRERLEAIARRPRSARSAIAPPVTRRPAKNRHRISACVVAAGGAPSLSQCLSSLDGAVDEIVVVDAESAEDMASVRNEALDRATGRWALMIDATCTLDPASVELLRRLVKRDRFVGYTARELRQFGFDGAVSAIEQRTAALFPRHPDLRYVGRVAEQLLPRRADLDFRLTSSGLVLRQHDHQVDRFDAVVRARRALPLLDRSAREAPEEPFHVYNLGVALQRLGLNSEAETALRTAIAGAAPEAIWRSSADGSLARAVAAQGRTAEAVTLCRAVTRRAPDWAQGWCLLGGALVAAGRQKAALRAYRRALKCSADTWLSSDLPNDTTWQVRAGIGRIHLSRHEYQEAAECLRGAVAQNRDSVELHVLLARAYEALGSSVEAGRHLQRATTVARADPQAAAAFGDFFTMKAEGALLRGLAENSESRPLLERIERLRAARAIASVASPGRTADE